MEKAYRPPFLTPDETISPFMCRSRPIRHPNAQTNLVKTSFVELVRFGKHSVLEKYPSTIQRFFPLGVLVLPITNLNGDNMVANKEGDLAVALKNL
jgi:hypothetical protein